MKALAEKEISTSMRYDTEKEKFFLDLETNAKSELHLYEDGMLRGRYGYETQIDLSKDIELLLTELCHEFNMALCGRKYCQRGWAVLCLSKGITLKCE